MMKNGFVLVPLFFIPVTGSSAENIDLTCSITFTSPVNQSVKINKPPVAWYVLNSPTGPYASVPSLAGSVYSDGVLVSDTDSVLGTTAVSQLEDYITYEAGIRYDAQVCAANSTLTVWLSGSKGPAKTCEAGYACIKDNDTVIYPLTVAGPGLIQASTTFKSTCNTGYVLSGVYGSSPPPLSLTGVPEATRFHAISLKDVSVSVTAPAMYGPTGVAVPSQAQKLTLNCNSDAVRVTVSAPALIDFGPLGTGEDATASLRVSSNAEGISGVTLSVSPTGSYDSDGLVLGGGHVRFYTAADGALIQPGQSIPLGSGGTELNTVLSGTGGIPGEATAGMNLTVSVP